MEEESKTGLSDSKAEKETSSLIYKKKKSVGIIYLNKIMSFCYILHINLHKLHINLFLINLYAFQMYKEKEKTISFKKEK